MEVRQLSGAVGAELSGIDLADPALDLAAIDALFAEHHALFLGWGWQLRDTGRLGLRSRYGGSCVRLGGSLSVTRTPISVEAGCGGA